MPVTSIEVLSNLGVLRRPLEPGACIAVEDACLIYAENGRGKSTLAAVFSSLQTGEASSLQRRRSAGTDADVAIRLVTAAGIHEFGQGAWNSRLQEVLVFDSTFVDTTLASGSRVLPEHRSRLFAFVLGEDIGSAVDRLNDVRRIRKQKQDHLEELDRQLAVVADGVAVREFVALERVDDVDAQLALAERLLADQRARDAVAARREYMEVPALAVRWDEISACLAADVSSLVRDSISSVIDHLHSHSEARFENWLNEGRGYATDTCPYCGQSLASSDIVEGFSAYFSAEYQRRVQQVSELTEQVKKASEGRDIP